MDDPKTSSEGCVPRDSRTCPCRRNQGAADLWAGDPRRGHAAAAVMGSTRMERVHLKVLRETWITPDAGWVDDIFALADDPRERSKGYWAAAVDYHF